MKQRVNQIDSFQSEFSISPKRAELTEEGYLRGDAYVTRTGIMKYSDFGTTSNRFRSPEEVFAPESLETLKNIPITIEHPNELLDVNNATWHSVGHLGENIRIDEASGRVLVNYLIIDPEAIKLIQDREKVEVSMGYTCEIVESVGDWKGNPYDSEQKSIRYNHMALTSVGRAGSGVKIVTDSKEKQVKKVTINNVQYDAVPEVANEIDRLNVELEGAKNAVEAKKSQMDSVNGQVEALNTKLAEMEAKVSQEAIATMVKAQMDSLNAIRKDFPAVQCDSVDPIEMKKACILSVQQDANLDGKSEAYLDGMLEILKAKQMDSDFQKDAQQFVQTDSNKPVTANSAREQMIKARQGAGA